MAWTNCLLSTIITMFQILLVRLFQSNKYFIHIGNLIVEKFDAVKFRQLFIEGGLQFERNRSRLVKMLGKTYFQELYGKDLERETNKAFVIRDDIKGEDQLTELMASEMQVRSNPEGLQY
jgi:hypothetical protein